MRLGSAQQSIATVRRKNEQVSPFGPVANLDQNRLSFPLPAEQRTRQGQAAIRFPAIPVPASRPDGFTAHGPRGATVRKSASRAIWGARVRARSERSPSAKACRRQAIRRKRCPRSSALRTAAAPKTESSSVNSTG
jgi:hypothetical protein